MREIRIMNKYRNKSGRTFIMWETQTQYHNHTEQFKKENEYIGSIRIFSL